jgi:hypothetical protein
LASTSRLADELQGAAVADELQPLTVPALKELCRARGLKVGGNKAELIARLGDSSFEASGVVSAELEPTSGGAPAAAAPTAVAAAAATPSPPFPSGSPQHTYTRAAEDTALTVGLDAELLHDLIATREVDCHPTCQNRRYLDRKAPGRISFMFSDILNLTHLSSTIF